MAKLRSYLLSPLFIIILLSFLPFFSIFLTTQLPHTSDGGVQIPRMAAFYKAVRDGNIPVRWAGDLNYGFGMPLFNFIYHVPFYLSTPLIALGVGLVPTFKIVLAVSYILSGIGCYLFALEFFRDQQKAFVMTILYQFAPFRLVEILVRGAVGGIYVYSFFPFVLWGLVKVSRRPSFVNISVTAFACAAMILSHNSLALVFFGVSVLFIFFFGNSLRDRTIMCISLLLGLFLSAFYWIPALWEHKYTYGDLFMKNLFKANFPPIQNFFIPNIFDNKALRVSEIAVHWGITHTLVVAVALVLLLKWQELKSQDRRIIVFSSILLLGALFFMNRISTPVWDTFSFLRQFQFPWRLLAVVVFATSLLVGPLFSLKRFSQPVFLLFFILLTVLSTTFYWHPTQGYDGNVNELTFWNYPLNTTYFGETDVIWSAGPAKSFPPSRVAVIEGTGVVTNLVKKNQLQTFTLNARGPVRIVSYTQYFPGWRVYIDGQKVPIEFQDQTWRGLITFFAGAGTHAVRIVFEETPVRLLSDILSVGTVVILTAGAGILWRKTTLAR